MKLTRTEQIRIKSSDLSKNISRWTSEEIQFVRNNSSMKDSELSQILNRSINSVRGKRRRLGINKKFQTKYSIDQDFFTKWTTEMAYILGYIFADGSIRTRPSGSELRIKSKEKSILKSINNSMKSNYPISKEETKTGPLYCLSINRKKIVFDLLELGLIPKKSKTMTFPWVPERLFYHFIRGVFDGDGHVRILGNSLETIFTSGSKDFLVALHKKLEYQNIKSKVYTKSYNSRKWYYLSIFNESREKFYYKLYKGATLFLRRKYIIFQIFFQNHHNLIIICENCGKSVSKTGRNQKRCKDCKKEYNREKNRRYYWRKKALTQK